MDKDRNKYINKQINMQKIKKARNCPAPVIEDTTELQYVNQKGRSFSSSGLLNPVLSACVLDSG